MLGQSWAAARQALMEEQRVLVNKAERHEFGKASGFALNVSQQAHLVDPVSGSFHVPVHHGRSGADAAAVGGFDDFDPLRGGKFIGGENVADFVVENLGGGARQRVEAVVTQHVQ